MSEDTIQTPRTFQDAQGASWDVSLNLLAARRVDTSDFSELTDHKFSIMSPTRDMFASVMSDTPLVFAVIWAIVQPQVKDNLGIDPKEDPEGAETEFLSRIDGPTVKSGRDAFWKALADFYPDHRTALLTLQDRIDHANAKIGERIRLMGGDLDEILDKQITKEMDGMKKHLEESMNQT